MNQRLAKNQTDKPRAVYRPALARDEFAYKLFTARNRLRLMLDAEFKPLGVTDATWRVLFFLVRNGDGILQKEIARDIGIEGPSLVRLLDRLEQQALIERRQGVPDRRGKTVHLTENARPLIAKLENTATSVRNRLLEGIPEEDLATCVSVLDQVIVASE